MPDLDLLPPVVRNRIVTRPIRPETHTPFTRPARPLAQATLALVTTAGLHLRDDRPFAKNDPTYRVIPSSVAERQLLQSTSSIGFDRTLRMRDINVVFPLDRLRELAERRTVGELAPRFYSFVGAQPQSSIDRIAAQYAPELARRLHEEGVDVVLLSPTCPVCTHTESVIQRALEEAGLTTVGISLVREYSEKLRPPRALYVPFPFGSPFGMPGDAPQQHRVLAAAFAMLDAPAGPVLTDFPREEYRDERVAPLQAAAVGVKGAREDVATEVTLMRRFHEQWLQAHGKTAVGLAGISTLRFRGVVRFLEDFADAKPGADMRERPADVTLANFVRYCCDDLRALYLEARLVMAPDESSDDTYRWLWGETALGGLIVRVRDRMEAADDDELRDAAFGIAR